MGKSAKTLLVTTKLRNHIHNNMIKKNVFDIEKYFEENKNMGWKSKSDPIDVIKEIPLTEVFSNIHELNTPYPCELIDNNKSWISIDENNHERYFTKGKGITHSFDLVDLMELYYGTNTSRILSYIDDRLDSSFNMQWKIGHLCKYGRNKEIISNIIEEDKDCNIMKIIGKYLYLLENINEIGANNIKNEAFSYKGSSIFFFSNNFLKSQTKIGSTSTINKVINLFCVLGLLEKVSRKVVSEFDEFKNLKTRKGLNPITFYIVPSYTYETLKTANRRASYLLKNNMKYYKLKNKDYVSLAIHFNSAPATYGENKKPEKQGKVQMSIESVFKSMFEEMGIVSKELLSESLDCSKKTIDVYWTRLIKKYGLKSRRPTNAEKEKYNLLTSLYIAY